MDLVIATHNPHKFAEISALLSDLDLALIPLPPSVVLPEDGVTLEENAISKGEAAVRATGEIALADDSGLEIDVLGGEPGVHSARFLGEGARADLRNRRILDLLRDVPPERRSAQFRCVIALANPGGSLYLREGVCRGRIAFSPQGEGGFGYDPIFFLPEYGRTLAEMSPAFKNQISHRGKALHQLRPVLCALRDSLTGGGPRPVSGHFSGGAGCGAAW